MQVLGIETSCDETAVAVYDSKNGIISHCLHSQIDLHNQYGGVVPELASREHILKVLPLINRTLTDGNTSFDLLDAIAYTSGPGLMGSLLVGSAIGRSLAYSLNGTPYSNHGLILFSLFRLSMEYLVMHSDRMAVLTLNC